MEAQELVRNTFVHIIRNSMDHGIETASERSAMGKTPEGHIQVSVSLEAGQLVIVYHDDGRGLNLRAIRRIALDRGLLKPDQNISSEDLAYLIFEPGFSTVETVNDISGRGVGMSAVKDYIEVKGGQGLPRCGAVLRHPAKEQRHVVGSVPHGEGSEGS